MYPSMDEVDKQLLFSNLDPFEQLLSDSQLQYPTNICLPSSSYAEQPQNLLAYSHFSLPPSRTLECAANICSSDPGLPSPTTVEGFAVSTGHLPHGGLHIPIPTAPGTMDFSMASNPGPGQPRWSGISPTFTHETLTPVPWPQSPYQIPHGPLCTWPREFESYPVPPSIPGISQSLLTQTYPEAKQYDARMSHNLDGTADTCASSPDGDTGRSDSGFPGAWADYELPIDARVDRRPSIALTHTLADMLPSVPSAAFPYDVPTCGPKRGARIIECQWLTNGTPCEASVWARRRSISEHLHQQHGIAPGDEKARQTCLWDGCRTKLNKESLARHILSVHLRERVHCPECGLLFAREDSLKRHLKGSQHKGPPDKHAAKVPSRNHTGFR